MNTLRYSARLERCAVLGPGNRAVFWVFGCCFSCKGCIGERYKTGRSLETTPQEAAEWYLRQNADGLTISGGEPMLQADALSETIGLIRAARDCGVIVYTGFVYEELLKKHDPDINRFLGQIDLLIDGPYIQDLDHNQPYRGSENQRFLLLTERYRTELETYYKAARSRQIELHFSEQQTMMAGVPGREQADIWRKIKELGERNVQKI
ncbi:MAG: radical SAM protein [Oscillibacter sp.]|nr:radical SAM protein [Oscillibacter sp.]